MSTIYTSPLANKSADYGAHLNLLNAKMDKNIANC